MKWELLHPRSSMEMLGYLPSFLSERDPNSAANQIDKNYGHGGGWRSFKGLKHLGGIKLQYPGDPPLIPIAQTMLRDEKIVFYNGAWVAIFQSDGTFDVARVD